MRRMGVSKYMLIGATATALFVGLGVGVFVGRYTAPTKTLERERIITVTDEFTARWHTWTSRTASANTAATQEVVRWKTEIVYRPDGTPASSTVTAERGASTLTASSSTAAAGAAGGELARKVEYKDREVFKLVERQAHPDWLLTAGVGLRAFDFSRKNVVVTVLVQRRMLGPVYAGAWASSTAEPGAPAGGLAVGLTF